MNEKMEFRIKNVMSAVFEIPIDDLDDFSSSDNIVSWDSLKHMNLIIALEEEMKIDFSENEIIKMTNYKIIKKIIDYREYS